MDPASPSGDAIAPALARMAKKEPIARAAAVRHRPEAD